MRLGFCLASGLACVYTWRQHQEQINVRKPDPGHICIHGTLLSYYESNCIYLSRSFFCFTCGFAVPFEMPKLSKAARKLPERLMVRMEE